MLGTGTAIWWVTEPHLVEPSITLLEASLMMFKVLASLKIVIYYFNLFMVQSTADLLASSE
jgi:hypothetical protein